MAVMNAGIKIGIPLFVTFVIGFAAGYKAKELRIKWVKKKRDKLLSKLNDTQKQLEVLAAI